jgi:hypothetical protein
VIDGEAVCCDDAGVAVFEKLHSRAGDDQAFLYAFDLLELGGEDWRPRRAWTTVHRCPVLGAQRTKARLSAMAELGQ